MRTRTRWNLLILAAALPLAACGGEEADDAMDEEAAPTPAAAPAEPAPMEPMAIMLEPRNESGVTGEATATHDADSVTVEVAISGATADGSFPAHVHEGDCTAPGGVLAPLNSLEVSGGSGSSTTALGASQVPEGQPAVIQVHDPTGAPVACGDLAGHGAMEGMGEGGMAGDTAGG